MRVRNTANPGSRLGMPLTAWPEHDQAAWSKAFAPAQGSRFRAPPGTRLRPPTRDSIMNGYARWLVWLLRHAPETLSAPLDGRATKDRVYAYLDDLAEEVTAQTMLGYACRLRRALELMCPAADWLWFSPIINELKENARVSKKAKRNFVPPHELLAFGQELMHTAEDSPHLSEQARAEAYRNGLMIAFLALRPLRLKNMTRLEIGTQLAKTIDGYDVTIPLGETKTSHTLEFPVPAVLVEPIGRYLDRYRPILVAGPAGAGMHAEGGVCFLWLARSGAMFPADTFAAMITDKVQARFGQRLTPHDFRHCAATAIAEFNPEDFHIIRIILGHTTIRTAEQYYIRAMGIEAARSYQAVLKRKRSELKRHVVLADRRPSGDGFSQ